MRDIGLGSRAMHFLITSLDRPDCEELRRRLRPAHLTTSPQPDRNGPRSSLTRSGGEI